MVKGFRIKKKLFTIVLIISLLISILAPQSYALDIHVNFTDEYGSSYNDPTLMINPNSIPSGVTIGDNYQAVYIGQNRYWVSDASDTVAGYGFVVLDDNYNLVTNEDIYNNAILTRVIGPGLANSWSPEEIDDLEQLAIDLRNVGGASYFFLTLRNLAAKCLGIPIGGIFKVILSQFFDVGLVIDIIVEDDDESAFLTDLWETYMDFADYLDTLEGYFHQMNVISAALAEIQLFGNALQRLNYAADCFELLRARVLLNS